MLKKITIGLLAAAMSVSMLAGCGGGTSSSAPAPAPSESGSGSAPAPSASAPAPAAAGDYKIGIITGTVSQGEEEFRAAENLKAKYGDKVVTATYPDKFVEEQQQVIQTIKNMAQEPGIKAIIMVQAVPGAKTAFEDIRNDPETKDILLIAGVPQEDPEIITKGADVIFQVDEANMGAAIAKQAKALGATKLVHYSFARHMSMAPSALRRDVMEQTCKEIGIEFIRSDECPDPTGDQGMSGAQQFMFDDVPRKIRELAPNEGDVVAFFNTNCGMQEPLIKSIMDGGAKAVFPQQCCPSPLHAYPGALGLSIPDDKKGDIPFIVGEIKKTIGEKGGAGRFSTWPVPVNMTFVDAGYNYAVMYAEGKLTGKNDKAAIEQCIKDVAGENVQIGLYTDANATYDNYYTVLSDYVVF